MRSGEPRNHLPHLSHLAQALVAGFVVLACSSGSKSNDCDHIAEQIREAAAKPRPPNFPNGWDGDGDGKPDAIGICMSTDATIKRDFGGACEALKACEER